MKKRIISSTLMFAMATLFCFASGYTLAVANHIIALLLVVVVALVLLICYGVHYNKVISQRNEQLRRILTALDDYRATIDDETLKPAAHKVAASADQDQSFFVKMDARVNKEKPFTDPDFDQDALSKFMDVSTETFCRLVPRYKEPARTLDYINSLRAEYAAKVMMENSDSSMRDIALKCGFTDRAAFNKAFRFSFGITPTDYLSGMNQMFKQN